MLSRTRWRGFLIPRALSIRRFHVKPHFNELAPNTYVQEEPKPEDEIIIAMSSGVDSSVSAAMYASKYRNVRGIYMANWTQTAKCIEADWKDVQKICQHIGIPCERVNFEKEYWNQVFEPMISMYSKGLTPNPDTGCNKYVKFGKMIEYLTNKFQNTKANWWLVTGHYSRIMKHRETGEYHLLRGYYGNKDQSFYLSNIPKKALSKVLLPIGHMIKPDVRKLAKDFQLHIAEKPDSDGLCFVGQETSSFREFLNEYIEPNPGNIITEDGKIWGQHKGLWHATIGQKLGISLPQGNPEYKGVWFISEKRFETNELVIVKGRDNPKLYQNGLSVSDWEWIIENPSQFSNSKELTLQYRSLQEPDQVFEFNQDKDEVKIKIKDKARAMAPGQNVVLYHGNTVLGSGVLKSTWNY
ncbi:hypothetical protein HYPBUDRAFT_152036 [Hyphopichia burtonii NRRL Y-1933]|uniref:tRNA-5-taurinomethyluridine 2-sulfurtransferase n=1 Tax=Hyphopichia burtonii NRRL Y-1933 TaxID=984485 RepID=A0A1E4RN01_9ASCO|nr:hypothetical protein HYPBUDRAFT_152036 [Hyphopichia burtonii NRRL Y-1933]ODV68654.1 hypothetical protein HYPBUDRAFT_152036 [Hyphopichia burtonii NRRL Y-1933]